MMSNINLNLELQQKDKLFTIHTFIRQELAEQAWFHYQIANERVTSLDNFQVIEASMHKKLLLENYQVLDSKRLA